MSTDDLERRLRRLDPTDGVPIEPATGPRAAALMEQIMNTPDVVTTVPTDHPSPRAPRWRRFAIAGGMVAIAAVGVFAFAASDDGGATTATAVTYDLGASDPMAMCLPVTEYRPTPGVVGFRGTVAEIGDGTVTLDVTKWYAGGDADQVVLRVADVASVALDGVEFTTGGDYLVSVLDGTVMICGISGPATPELEALYDTWFAS